MEQLLTHPNLLQLSTFLIGSDVVRKVTASNVTWETVRDRGVVSHGPLAFLGAKTRIYLIPSELCFWLVAQDSPL